jgi:hypothetical protein
MTIRKGNFDLINKNVLGEDFLFLCSADSERVVCGTFTFSRTLLLLLLLIIIIVVVVASASQDNVG